MLRAIFRYICGPRLPYGVNAHMRDALARASR